VDDARARPCPSFFDASASSSSLGGVTGDDGFACGAYGGLDLALDGLVAILGLLVGTDSLICDLMFANV
jgi:hypothetical protein